MLTHQDGVVEKSDVEKVNKFSLQKGTFCVGVNYWASHSGTDMWSNWKEEVVRADLIQLKKDGINIVRVFPLWSDFQPIEMLYEFQGREKEIRSNGKLVEGEKDNSGVDLVMMERFGIFLKLAKENEIDVIVGLVTGWMSGRLFIPSALKGKNILTDPQCLIWQIRFVRRFVETFGFSETIVGWDLGNECNCLGQATRSEAWVWSNAITQAIRISDPFRPVISGMHSLEADPGKEWTIRDQGELTDLLTTHPYPPFTPHCGMESIVTLRSLLHASAESRLYADLGKREVLVEEFGILGPNFGDDVSAALYLRANLYSLWAHDCRGLLWWCAYDQSHLTHPPYDWNQCEQELGLYDEEKAPKKAVAEIKNFQTLQKERSLPKLPPYQTDAICILTGEQEHWAVAYQSFILAKQAGFDLRFQYCDESLEDSAVYMLPSLSGLKIMSQDRLRKLLQKIRGGATLYLSFDDGILTGFEKITGLRIVSRERRKENGKGQFEMEGNLFNFQSDWKRVLEVSEDYSSVSTQAHSCKFFAREKDGTPCFSKAQYGKGKVIFLSFPLEKMLSQEVGGYTADGVSPYWKVYERVVKESSIDRIVSRGNPMVGVTEHPLSTTKRLIVMINYTSEQIKDKISFHRKWKISSVIQGAISENEVEIAPCGVAIVETSLEK